MEFFREKSFGYPVLGPGRVDYTGGAQFQPTIKPKPYDDKKKELITFECDFAVSVPEIRELIKKEKAQYCVVLDCRDTFMRKAYCSFEGEFSFDEAHKEFHGQVFIEAYIIITEDIDNFHSSYFHPFFREKRVQLKSGMVIAQAETVRWNAFNENFETIAPPIDFHIDDNLKDGEWYFESESPTVYLYANQNQMDYFAQFDSPTLLNSILVPVVVKMIETLQDPKKAEDCEDYSWAVAIRKKLIDAELTFESFGGEPMRIAGHILGFPMRKCNTKFSAEDDE